MFSLNCSNDIMRTKLNSIKEVDPYQILEDVKNTIDDEYIGKKIITNLTDDGLIIYTERKKSSAIRIIYENIDEILEEHIDSEIDKDLLFKVNRKNNLISVRVKRIISRK